MTEALRLLCAVIVLWLLLPILSNFRRGASQSLSDGFVFALALVGFIYLSGWL